MSAYLRVFLLRVIHAVIFMSSYYARRNNARKRNKYESFIWKTRFMRPVSEDFTIIAGRYIPR